MSEALAVQSQQSLVHLVARNPVEMQQAREGLAEWLKRKIESLDTEVTDLNAAINEARNAKWNFKALEKQRDARLLDQDFYAKILQAVEAGYTIIPEFPVDLFAIRVERGHPTGPQVNSRYGKPTPWGEQCDELPAGTGEYVSPIPQVERSVETRTETNYKNEQTSYKVNLADPITFKNVVFPLRAARPEVMNATAEAMALQLFDQIGICPPRRQPDPMIIGQIVRRERAGRAKAISFIIAWHLNLNEL